MSQLDLFHNCMGFTSTSNDQNNKPSPKSIPTSNKEPTIIPVKQICTRDYQQWRQSVIDCQPKA